MGNQRGSAYAVHLIKRQIGCAMTSSYCKQCILLVSSVFLNACGSPALKSTLPLDLSRTGTIEITVKSETKHLDTNVIANQTRKNLSSWHYPVVPEPKVPVSHRLTAHIGTTEHASTPNGFSFNMGNSDPRALDFQKAEVLTISCQLNALEQTAQSAELSMGFSDTAVTASRPDLNELSDHVSTVCFNLLRQLKWPLVAQSDAPNGAKSSATTGWIPEIRIETVMEPDTKAPSNENRIEGKSVENSKSSPHSAPEDTSKIVTREVNKEGRKIYIMHNQGSPIIFKFGHERQ